MELFNNHSQWLNVTSSQLLNVFILDLKWQRPIRPWFRWKLTNHFLPLSHFSKSGINLYVQLDVISESYYHSWYQQAHQKLYTKQSFLLEAVLSDNTLGYRAVGRSSTYCLHLTPYSLLFKRRRLHWHWLYYIHQPIWRVHIHPFSQKRNGVCVQKLAYVVSHSVANHSFVRELQILEMYIPIYAYMWYTYMYLYLNYYSDR